MPVARCALIASVLVAGCGRLQFQDIPAKLDDATPAGSDASGAATPDAAPGQADAGLGAFATDCVLLMRMDEATWTGEAGEVKDECGMNPGTTSGGLTTVPNGTRGRAGLFNGQGCIAVPDSASLDATSALTMSAWVYPTGDATNSFGVIARRVDVSSDNAYSVFLWTANQMWSDIDTTNDRFHGNFVFPQNAWSQITVVYDGSLSMAKRTTMYVNGAFDLVSPETSASITPTPSPLSVGCLPLGGDVAQQFIGELDDVAIWRRPLSAAEVAEWYAQTKP